MRKYPIVVVVPIVEAFHSQCQVGRPHGLAENDPLGVRHCEIVFGIAARVLDAWPDGGFGGHIQVSRYVAFEGVGCADGIVHLDPFAGRVDRVWVGIDVPVIVVPPTAAGTERRGNGTLIAARGNAPEFEALFASAGKQTDVRGFPPDIASGG